MSAYKVLDPLARADVKAISIDEIASFVEGNRSKYASHLQFALHSFCQTKQFGPEEDRIFNEIAALCYTESCLKYLNDMGRFTGCVSSVVGYCCERKLTDKALKMCAVLQKKAKEIEEASKNSIDVVKNLFICCHHLHKIMPQAAAVGALKGVELLDIGLSALELVKTSDDKIAKNLTALMLYSISFIKGHTEKLGPLIKRYINIAKTVGCMNTSSLTDYMTLRLSSSLSLAEPDCHAKVKNELIATVQLMGMENLNKEWTIVAEFFTNKNIDSLQLATSCVAATKKLILSAKTDEKARCIVILLSFFACKWWTTSCVDVIEELYKNFVLYIHKESADVRHCFVRSGPSTSYTIRVIEALAKAFQVIALKYRHHFKHQTEGCIGLSTSLCDAFLLFWSLEIESDEIECVWNNFVSTVCNAVEDIFMMCTINPDWCYLARLCRVVAVPLATTKRKLPVGKERIDLIFYRWAFACSKMNNSNEIMVVRALQMLVCPWAVDEAMTEWCRAKLMEDNQHKSLSIFQFLKQEEAELRQIFPALLDLSTLEEKTLLISELRAYRAVASFELEEIVLNVWNQLKKFKLTVIESAIGLSSVIFFHIWTASKDLVAKYSKDCRKVLVSLAALSDDDPKEAARSCCYRGILKFSLILCRMRKRNIAMTAVLQALTLDQLKKEAEEKAKFGEEVDMNMTCDVDPTGGSLSLEEEQEIVTNLVEIAETWRELPTRWVTAALSPSEAGFMLEFMRLLANMAALYDASIVSTRVWVIYYQIAIQSDDKIGQLRALTELIAIAEPSSESGICTMAKNISTAFLSSGKLSQDATETVVTFQFNFIEILLLEGKTSTALEYMLNCKPIMGRLKNELTYLMMKGRYMCLATKLLLASPESAESLAVGSIQFAAYNGFSHLKIALEKCKNGVLGTAQFCSLLLTTLDVCLWCVEIFNTLYLTLWVRTLVESQYKICMNLGITSRTSQLLAVLVHVDLTNDKLSEARAKLNNLQTLLGLPPSEARKEEVTLLTISRARSRELSPVRFSKGLARVKSPLSEMLPKKCFSAPSWNHPPSCTCHPCQSYLLKLVLIHLRLCEAIAASMAGNFITSAAIYHDCNALINRYNPHSIQDAILRELSAFPPGTCVNAKSRQFDVLRAKFNMKYASFCMLPEETKSESSARMLLDQTDGILSGLSYDKVLLEWSYLELECCFLTLKKKETKTPVPSTAPVQLLAPPTAEILKTPRPSRQRKEITVKAPRRKVVSATVDSPHIFKRPGRRVFEEKSTADASTSSVIKTPVTGGSKKAKVAASSSNLLTTPEPSASKQSKKLAPSSSKSTNPERTASKKLEVPAPSSNMLETPGPSVSKETKTFAPSSSKSTNPERTASKKLEVPAPSSNMLETPGPSVSKETKTFASSLSKSTNPGPTLLINEKVTPSTRKQPPRSVAKSIRLVETDTVKRRPRQIRSIDLTSDSDEDIVPASPEMVSTVKANKSRKKPTAKTRVLEFDDEIERPTTSSQPEVENAGSSKQGVQNASASLKPVVQGKCSTSEPLNEFDASKDLFESFEQMNLSKS